MLERPGAENAVTLQNAQDLRRLDSAVRLSRRSRLGRIVASPIRGTYARAIEAYSRLTRKPVRHRTQTFWRESFNAVLPERLSICMARYGFFEAELTRVFLDYLKPGMIFFDVGAHFGYYSLLASRLVGESGQVHSFEPTPSTFAVLRSNLAHKANVRLNNVAAFRADTTLEFQDFGLDQSMFNSVYGARTPEAARTKMHASRTTKVTAVAIDNYCEKSGVKPDFVKIDAEGAEPDVLSGMQAILRRKRPSITLEVGDWGVNGSAPSHQVVQSLLDMGYRAMEHHDGTLRPHQLKRRYEYDNLLFLPA